MRVVMDKHIVAWRCGRVQERLNGAQIRDERGSPKPAPRPSAASLHSRLVRRDILSPGIAVLADVSGIWIHGHAQVVSRGTYYLVTLKTVIMPMRACGMPVLMSGTKHTAA